MNDIFTNRRSIRKYSNNPVSEELLDSLLEKACRASNTGNMQTYSIVVTRDEAIKKALSPCHFNQPMVMSAPVVLTFCADYNRFKKWCLLRDAEPGYDNFMSFLGATIDAVIAAQTLCMAAEAEGLGICYLGTTIYTADKIIETLQLPKGVVPITTVTLGFPNETPEQSDRLPLEAIVHKDIYSDYTDKLIDELYSEKEAREDMKRFVAENGKTTLAQVFTDVRYTKKDNEYCSEVLLRVLREQGFLE